MPFRVTLIVLIGTLGLHKASGQDIIVQGMVTDRNYRGISGVTIRAESNGRPVGHPIKSDIGGSYTLKCKKGQDFDLIYNHSAWHPDTFKRLSGEKDHSINKVLYRPGGESDYSATVVLNILQAYEYVFTVESVAGHSVEELKGEYGARLAAIKSLPKTSNEAVTKMLERKRESVFELFGIPVPKN
jgi:hypothetical protein